MNKTLGLWMTGIALPAFALTASALAQTQAMITADLNVRAGPGPHFDVIGVLEKGSSVPVNGCLSGSKWCTVPTSSGDGWVYSDYLTLDRSGSVVVLSESYADAGVPVVTYEGPDPAAGVAVGATTGAVAGAIIGGPVGAAVGATAGAAIGGTTVAAIEPPEEVRTYVTSHQVDPVYLEGEVVVGASLPETVELREIPDYQYRYVYVNGIPALVEPDTRRVVYIVR